MKFDFDAPLERAGTWSTRWERYAGRDVIPLWVADSDFRAPPCVLEALEKRIKHGVFGYTTAPEELREAIVERLERLYRWRIDPSWIVFLPGVVPGLHLAARKLLPPDGHALVPTPVYQHFKRALELAPRAHTDLQLVLQHIDLTLQSLGLSFLRRRISGHEKRAGECSQHQDLQSVVNCHPTSSTIWALNG